jgi:hypothetical protein
LAKRCCHLSVPLCLLLVAACDRQRDADAPLAPRTPPAAVSNGAGTSSAGVRLALLRPSGHTDLAALEGTLHAEGGCLYIVGSDKTRNRTLPAFALEGVRWDEPAKTLHVRDATFAQGQRIVLGGGEPADPAALRWVQRPDPSCDASDLFVAGTIDPATTPPSR